MIIKFYKKGKTKQVRTAVLMDSGFAFFRIQTGILILSVVLCGRKGKGGTVRFEYRSFSEIFMQL